jgi:hypothetical protein
MGPQGFRIQFQPSVKGCKIKRCTELVPRTNGQRPQLECRLTGKIPGNQAECPLETNNNCPQLIGCPRLLVDSMCSQCESRPGNVFALRLCSHKVS